MYFVTIITTAHQDKIEDVSKKHNTRLNNYLTYGVSFETPPEGFQKLEKQKEVEHMNTTETIHNMYVYLKTILCCENDESTEARY